jgi:hypothetical protein
MALWNIGRRAGLSKPRYREPTIAEMLSDSIVEAVMKADNIDPRALAAELRMMAAKISVGYEGMVSSRMP